MTAETTVHYIVRAATSTVPQKYHQYVKKQKWVWGKIMREIPHCEKI